MAEFSVLYTIEVHSVSVDYGMSLKKLIKAGKYDRVDSNITQKNFPTSRKGKVEIEIGLFHFNKYISSKDALEEIEKARYRPAEVHELLTLGKEHPDFQRKFPIVALGSVRRDPYGVRDVPYLDGHGSERFLLLDYLEYEWNWDWRFAAVRKSR